MGRRFAVPYPFRAMRFHRRSSAWQAGLIAVLLALFLQAPTTAPVADRLAHPHASATAEEASQRVPDEPVPGGRTVEHLLCPFCQLLAAGAVVGPAADPQAAVQAADFPPGAVPVVRLPQAADVLPLGARAPPLA